MVLQEVLLLRQAHDWQRFQLSEMRPSVLVDALHFIIGTLGEK